MLQPQVHWPFGSGEDFKRGLTIYGPDGYLGHVIQIPQNFFVPPDSWMFHLEKLTFENNGHIHVYSPCAGADNPLGSEVLYKHRLCFILAIFPFNGFLTVTPI